MFEIVIFLCTGLLVYWCSRTRLLFRGSEEEIEEVLEADLWYARRLMHALRNLFFPALRMLP